MLAPSSGAVCSCEMSVYTQQRLVLPNRFIWLGTSPCYIIMETDPVSGMSDLKKLIKEFLSSYQVNWKLKIITRKDPTDEQNSKMSECNPLGYMYIYYEQASALAIMNDPSIAPCVWLLDNCQVVSTFLCSLHAQWVKFIRTNIFKTTLAIHLCLSLLSKLLN